MGKGIVCSEMQKFKFKGTDGMIDSVVERASETAFMEN